MSLHVKVQQKAYLYVYLSNEQAVQTNVYFDDLKITHNTNIEQIAEYYPFGLQQGSNSFARTGSTNNPLTYNGKELQDELNLGWLDFGARMYMSDIARWGAFDPLAETSRRWSPYNYAMDNPMRFIDPDGMSAEESLGDWMKRKDAEDKARFSGRSTASRMEQRAAQESAALREEQQAREQQAAQESSEQQAENNAEQYDAQQPSVILDADGNVKSWDDGANLVYVDDGNGNLVLFHDRLARSGVMTPEAFSNGLLSVVKGMKLLPISDKVKQPGYNGTFDENMLYGGHIRVSLFDGTKAYTQSEYDNRNQAYTNWHGVPDGKIMITYQGMGGKSLTVDSLRSVLGFHEYYAHGMEHLSHPIKGRDPKINAAEEARIVEIVNLYKR